jgi:osmotically-inducible protein OsmY
MASLKTFVTGAGLGAAAAYFLDNQSGARRRSVARDKTKRFTRQGSGAVQGAAQQATNQAQGVAAKAKSAATSVTGGGEAPDDVTLARKVETEIFRDADAPKGAVNVHAVNGIVELRGQLNDRAQIEALVAKARAVSGVQDVRNLMHLPGETPPNIAGTPGVS